MTIADIKKTADAKMAKSIEALKNDTVSGSGNTLRIVGNPTGAQLGSAAVFLEAPGDPRDRDGH